MIFHQPGNSQPNYNSNAFFYTKEVWESHFHKNFELIYVLSGGVSCTVNGLSCRLGPGDFGLCLPFDVHRYVPEQDTRYWVLVFSEDFVQYFAKSIAGKQGEGFAFRCQPAVEEYVLSQMVEQKSPSILTLKSCLYAVCQQYSNAVRLVERKHRKPEAVTAITDYVREHHTQALSLQDISRQIGYDYNYMSRYFHNMFNMSFTDFVSIYRLETAVDLLEHTDLDMATIALESGFQSVRSFYHAFQKHMQISPAKYRNAPEKKRG